MRALGFAPLAVLLCAVVLTVYFSLPAPEPIVPLLTTEQARALYGPYSSKGQELLNRANEILAGIQKKCSEQGLEYLGPTQLLPTSTEFSSHSYRRGEGIRTVVQFSTAEVEIKIGANDRSLISYANTALEKRIENGPYFDPPYKPKLSQQTATDLAVDFLFVGPNGNNIQFALPQAKYEPNGEMETKTGWKTQQGYWWVRWLRKDNEGHMFAGDSSLVTFAEGYGPSFITNSLDTLYHKDPAATISQEVAEKAAKQFLAANVSWAGAPFATTNLEVGALQVCRASRHVRNYESGVEDEGRLAWAQAFGCQFARLARRLGFRLCRYRCAHRESDLVQHGKWHRRAGKMSCTRRRPL